MKSLSLYAALILVALTSGGISVAQQSATADPQSSQAADLQSSQAAGQQPSRADVIRMMDAMRIRSQMESMKKMMNKQMKQMMDQTLQKQPTVTPEQKSRMESAYAEGSQLYPVSEMMEDMIPVYQRHMSKTDIDAIVTFYGSPAGQHLLTETPAIMQDSMAVLMPKIQTRMQSYMEKIQKDAGSTTPKAGSTPSH